MSRRVIFVSVTKKKTKYIKYYNFFILTKRKRENHNNITDKVRIENIESNKVKENMK